MKGDVAQDQGSVAGAGAGIAEGVATEAVDSAAGTDEGATAEAESVDAGTAVDGAVQIQATITGQETSLNYLALDVLEACGLPTHAFMSSLAEIREEYPVITAIGTVDKEGNLQEAKEVAEELQEYQGMQYYLLFDYEE